jgi:uncharacterized protein YcbK (DUF882 family)
VSSSWTRRLFLQTAVIGGAGATFARKAAAQADSMQGKGVSESLHAERAIHLFNTHTSETVSVIYRRGNEYDAAAIASLRNVMRDHVNGESHDIDVRLYDQLHDLALAARCDPSFEIISGYRSPETNSKMAAASSGVAKHSLHMQGRAIDVRLHHCSCADLRDLALNAARGGVGYYEHSDFVHIDTGAFRTWNG